MPTPKEITDLLRDPTPEKIALIGKAYGFAEEAHKDHKRYSCEPYFNHLFETAKILAELGMGAATVSAGLLHDSIEDVAVSPETLKKEFGEEIVMLVEGVTNLGHIKYHGHDRYSENMRRLFIASSRDLRVLIIKLADRLHNMRTLGFVPREKQKRIAIETLEIYAPIAYRLGIRKVSREMQDLALPFAHPEDFARTTALLATKQSELEHRLTKFHPALLAEFAKQNITASEATKRLKGLYSLYIKLTHKNWEIEKVYDMLAVRVIMKTVEDCYRALGAVHSLWRPLPGRIKDYIAFPKPNGYRSLHTTVFTGDGGTVEIQIRTEEMHQEAEYGIATHFAYKELAREKTRDASYLDWAKRFFSALLLWRPKQQKTTSALPTETPGGETPPHWVRQLGDLDSSGEEREFWERLRSDVFNNRVFIFTPRGDVVDLPADASPIDFAYAIHSDLGGHLVGAKVNGKLVGIDSALKNGDIVEILTKKNARPSLKWLEIAKTAVARKHIRTALHAKVLH